MLIVGALAKMRRRSPGKTRAGAGWYLYVPSIIAQLYDAAGYDVIVTSTADMEVNSDGPYPTVFHFTCRLARQGDTIPPGSAGRLWIAENRLHGTLRLPPRAILQDMPDVISGFLSAYDADSSLPYLVWKGDL